jgi:hypothetical protein
VNIAIPGIELLIISIDLNTATDSSPQLLHNWTIFHSSIPIIWRTSDYRAWLNPGINPICLIIRVTLPHFIIGCTVGSLDKDYLGFMLLVIHSKRQAMPGIHHALSSN